jgi:hypothetical protein
MIRYEHCGTGFCFEGMDLYNLDERERDREREGGREGGR